LPALVVAALCAGGAAAALPEGPQLTLLEYREGPARTSLFSSSVGAPNRQDLVSGNLQRPPIPYPFVSPSWSADAAFLAFTADVGHNHNRHLRTKVFLAPADGSSPHPLDGTAEGWYPVVSPDGHTVAFGKHKQVWRPKKSGGERLAYESESVWLADLNGGPPRQITPWRDRLYFTPSSFSPNGRTLAMTRRARNRAPAIVAMDLADRRLTVLARDALEPSYSPDGMRIAYVGGRSSTFKVDRTTETTILTDLFVMTADGTGARRLTGTPGALELTPDWDPSGSHVVYTRISDIHSRSGLLGFGDSIVELDLHSGCSRSLFSRPKVVYFGAIWRAGAEGAAPPLSC
jgi:Tol biopolymer transport system component